MRYLYVWLCIMIPLLGDKENKDAKDSLTLDDWTNGVEQLTDLGLNADAAKLHELQEALSSGELTGDELHNKATEAETLAAKLRELGHADLAHEAGELADKLKNAAKAKFGAEMKG